MAQLNSANSRVQLVAEPTRTVAGAVGYNAGGHVAQFNLTFQGIAFNAVDVFDALITKYGAGKVIMDTDTAAQSNYRLRITA